MTYTLAIGDRMYSSWSLRGWMLFAPFDVHVNVRLAFMGTPDFRTLLADFAPAQLVPAMKNGDIVAWDSLAIAETLAEAHPDIRYWPEDTCERAMARSLVAEMHSGLNALRSDCPMNLRQGYSGFEPSDDVLRDIARLELLWGMTPDTGPWLFGDFTIADAFFAPVAARIAAYDLPVNASASAYVAQHLVHPNFRQWRAMAFANDMKKAHYEFDLPATNWPGPTPIPAHAVEGGKAVNELCPYSGKPIVPDSLAEFDGVVVGFCNQFCRDKSVADAEAWPALVELLRGK